MKSYLLVFAVIVVLIVSGCAQVNNGDSVMHDVKIGNVTVTWLGHASFMITGSKTVYVDPYVLPDNATKADYILVTHEHFDHCDVNNINSLKKEETRIIGPLDCVTKLTGKTNSVKPGEYFSYRDGFRAEAVEAYNTNKFRSGNQVFHPRGLGVGFVLIIDGVKIYHAGDTDSIPEMKDLANQSIDVALLPVGGTYTMTVEEASEAAQVIKPKQLIPMHYNSDKYGVTGINANPNELEALLAGKDIVVNVLKPLV